MDKFSKQIYEAGINDGRAEGKAEYIKNLISIQCKRGQQH